MNKAPAVVKPNATTPIKYTVQEAMAKTGTTTPKAALAALNVGRRGRNRFAYTPQAPGSPGRSREAERRRKQAEKAAAKHAGAK